MSELDRQRRDGPYLDRLFPVRLPSGRVATVKAVTVLPSNVGIMEGGMRPEHNAEQRELVRRLAYARHGGPLVIVEPLITPIGLPGRERLPWMACAARLASRPLDPDMVESELTLVWWQDAFTAPLPAEIEAAVAGVDWEREAEDVDLP